jgi:hypothetical protein
MPAPTIPGYHFDLVEIGRAKFTGRVQVNSLDDLFDEVAKHLRSGDIELNPAGMVIVGGFRPVGNVRPANDIAAAQFKRWVEAE